MTIAIIGLGVVGISTAFQLKNYQLTVVDNNADQLLSFHKRVGEYIQYREKFPDQKIFLWKPKRIADVPLTDIEAYIICLPTPLHETYRTLDTSIIEEYLKQLPEDATIIIRSTVPIGYFKSVQTSYPKMKFGYIPEFLREDNAVKDTSNLDYVIIAGDIGDLDLLTGLTDYGRKQTYHVSLEEAEIIKLAHNGAISMRLAFFGEINRYCVANGMNGEKVIGLVTQHPRIGKHYKRLPYRIAGKCLPKDLITLASTLKSQVLNAAISLIGK